MKCARMWFGHLEFGTEVFALPEWEHTITATSPVWKCWMHWHVSIHLIKRYSRTQHDWYEGRISTFTHGSCNAHLTARCTGEQSQQWGWGRGWCQIAFWSYEEAAYPFLHMSTPKSRWRAVKCLSACASLRSCSHRAHGLKLRLGLGLQVKLDQLIKWQR